MSKLYQLQRMGSAPAAGSIITSLIGGAAKLVGKLTQSKATKAAIAYAKANPGKIAAGAAGAAGVALGLTSGGGGRGASGSWGRRRKGITATELRGFRKVSCLLHKEGMSIRKPASRRRCA